MTSLKAGKNRQKLRKTKPLKRRARGAADGLRACLLHSEGRRLALAAVRAPEGCTTRHGQLRHVEPDRQ